VTGPWTYARVEDAGHWMQLDRPHALNRLLLEFLTRVESPARL
jgi:pimeloyl-ACP methyl ester carboxylesterase